MVAGNEPPRAVPAVCVGVARADLSACLGKHKRIKACVYSIVATNIDEAQVNRPRGAILEKMMEIVFLLCRRETWLVGDGRQ